MARSKKTPETDPQLLLNSPARDAHLNAQYAEWYRLDASIKAARDETLKPLTAARTKLRRELKAAVDMDQEDLKIGYSVYKRQMETLGFEDEGKRDRAQENLRGIFRSLVAGGQVDFLKALDDDADEETAEKPGFMDGIDPEDPDFAEDARSGPEKVQDAQDGADS